MRCRACQEILTDFEATRKFKSFNDYVELCDKCYFTVIDDLEYHGDKNGSFEVREN